MIKPLPLVPDEIFSLNQEFANDPRPEKINGGIGVYLDEQGAPFVLPVVKKVIKSLNFDSFNYLPIAGDKVFLEETASLFLGERLYEQFANYFIKQGTMGGTNGLFVWCSLIKEFDKKPAIIISNPSWENHIKIFSYFGFEIITYEHLDTRHRFNLLSLLKTLKDNPDAYLLLQGGPTHNPTGANPDKKQWEKLMKAVKKGRHQILFDFAYLGLGDNIEKDCFGVRMFIKNKIATSVVISYSKNMTLYQHRTGGLFIFVSNPRNKQLYENHLQKNFRIINSNPAAFGEIIVKTILSDKKLKNQWQKEVAGIVTSLMKRRTLLADNLPPQFKHLKNERGLFSLLGLSPNQVKVLKEKHAIFLLSSSRMNFGGIALKNIPRVAKSILSTI